jgi:hypothetical protein
MGTNDSTNFGAAFHPNFLIMFISGAAGIVTTLIGIYFLKTPLKRSLEKRKNKESINLKVIAKMLANDKEKKYRDLSGMIRLANELQQRGIQVKLIDLFGAFGGFNGKKEISRLTGIAEQEIHDLNWSDYKNFNGFIKPVIFDQKLRPVVLQLIVRMIKENEFNGIDGQLKLAEVLEYAGFTKEELYGALNKEDRPRTLSIFFDDFDNFDSEYEKYKEKLNSILKDNSSKDEEYFSTGNRNNNNKYHGKEGMIRFAKELALEKIVKMFNEGEFEGIDGKENLVKELTYAGFTLDELSSHLNNEGWVELNISYDDLKKIVEKLKNYEKPNPSEDEKLLLTDGSIQGRLDLIKDFHGKGREFISATYQTSEPPNDNNGGNNNHLKAYTKFQQDNYDSNNTFAEWFYNKAKYQKFIVLGTALITIIWVAISYFIPSSNGYVKKNKLEVPTRPAITAKVKETPEVTPTSQDDKNELNSISTFENGKIKDTFHCISKDKWLVETNQGGDMIIRFPNSITNAKKILLVFKQGTFPASFSVKVNGVEQKAYYENTNLVIELVKGNGKSINEITISKGNIEGPDTVMENVGVSSDLNEILKDVKDHIVDPNKLDLTRMSKEDDTNKQPSSPLSALMAPLPFSFAGIANESLKKLIPCPSILFKHGIVTLEDEQEDYAKQGMNHLRVKILSASQTEDIKNITDKFERLTRDDGGLCALEVGKYKFDVYRQVVKPEGVFEGARHKYYLIPEEGDVDAADKNLITFEAAKYLDKFSELIGSINSVIAVKLEKGYHVAPFINDFDKPDLGLIKDIKKAIKSLAATYMQKRTTIALNMMTRTNPIAVNPKDAREANKEISDSKNDLASFAVVPISMVNNEKKLRKALETAGNNNKQLLIRTNTTELGWQAILRLALTRSSENRRSAFGVVFEESSDDKAVEQFIAEAQANTSISSDTIYVQMGRTEMQLMNGLNVFAGWKVSASEEKLPELGNRTIPLLDFDLNNMSDDQIKIALANLKICLEKYKNKNIPFIIFNGNVKEILTKLQSGNAFGVETAIEFIRSLIGPGNDGMERALHSGKTVAGNSGELKLIIQILNSNNCEYPKGAGALDPFVRYHIDEMSKEQDSIAKAAHDLEIKNFARGILTNSLAIMAHNSGITFQKDGYSANRFFELGIKILIKANGALPMDNFDNFVAAAHNIWNAKIELGQDTMEQLWVKCQSNNVSGELMLSLFEIMPPQKDQIEEELEKAKKLFKKSTTNAYKKLVECA